MSFDKRPPEPPPQNPYASPAHFGEADVSRNITETIKRPISVWFMQTLFILFISLFGMSLFNIVRDSYTSNSYPSFSSTSSLGNLLFVITTICFFIAALSWALIATFQRKYWSKWIGVVLLLLILSFVLLRTETTYYANEAERLGGAIARYAVIPALLIWWIYAFAFSKKAQGYFVKSSIQSTPQNINVSTDINLSKEKT